MWDLLFKKSASGTKNCFYFIYHQELIQFSVTYYSYSNTINNNEIVVRYILYANCSPCTHPKHNDHSCLLLFHVLEIIINDYLV